MDIYDSRYFSLNKRFLIIIGLWPFISGRYVVRSLWLLSIIILNIPHLIGIYINRKNVELLWEHFTMQGFLIGPSLKLVFIGLAEKEVSSIFLSMLSRRHSEMIILYGTIVENWKLIVDVKEKSILHEFSEKGRILTIAYTGFIAFGYVCIIMPSFTPIVLDMIFPLNDTRPYVYIFHGEFLLNDRDTYYWSTTLWDIATLTPIVVIVASVDTMYSACVKHCLGLFDIIKYRLQTIEQTVSDDSAVTDSCLSYDRMVQIIKLHKTALQSSRILENSYSLCFFMLMTIHLVALPMVSVMITQSLSDPISFLRYGTLFVFLIVHQLYLNWAAQELVDCSGNLLYDSYCSEWYNSSKETKKLLRFFALRCTKPCSLTSGKIMQMNMENFSKITKTALSYITVLASFQPE